MAGRCLQLYTRNTKHVNKYIKIEGVIWKNKTNFIYIPFSFSVLHCLQSPTRFSLRLLLETLISGHELLQIRLLRSRSRPRSHRRWTLRRGPGRRQWRVEFRWAYQDDIHQIRVRDPDVPARSRRVRVRPQEGDGGLPGSCRSRRQGPPWIPRGWCFRRAGVPWVRWPSHWRSRNLRVSGHRRDHLSR